MIFSQSNNGVQIMPRKRRVFASLSVVFALCMGQAASAQTFALPNPLDTDGSGMIALGYFSFSTDIEDQILAADQRAKGRLTRAIDHDGVEVFVILVANWKMAGLANASLIANPVLRDALDAKVGSDHMLALYDGQSDYVAYDKVLFALTEIDGLPVSEDCLIAGILTSLYEGVTVPTFDMANCMQVRQ